MGLDYSRMIVGYHGTDESIAQQALLGHTLKPSTNDYDWLGNGIYFWEQGPSRALDFAIEMNQKRPSLIRKPAVIGAYLHLGDCLDLLDVENTILLAEFYDFSKKEFRGIKNRKVRTDGTKLFHNLDCAVINALVTFLQRYQNRTIDSVRGCFWEGGPVFPGAQIRRKSHIQIAVRNPECVVGYFRPRIRF